jgi:DNA-directed RNA polymerase specialized sigma24 family protein
MAAEVEEEPVTLSWREVDALLRYWGSSRWRVGLCGGFPQQSACAGRVELYEPRDWLRVHQLTAQGRQKTHYGGHRILYYGAWAVSERLLSINAAVNTLPEPQFRAIFAAYAIGYISNEDFSHKQKAAILEITPDAFSERLRRARKKLAVILANATGRR